MKLYLWFLLSVLILLGGCVVVGFDYVLLSVFVLVSFGVMLVGIDGSGVEIEWWCGFDELVLEFLI